jgi:signal transduction histidine kinase
VAAGIVGIAVLEGLRSLLARWVRHMISPGRPTAGPVREMLAESIGDRSLSILYWLPERETYVDESGRRAELPDPASGRAWTAVDREGHRVAAIVHDAELDAGPDLVHAAAAAAVLALDNERLKADLRARLEELRRSRVRIVEAADAARRRIERDLHDGAQQQLVSLSLDLRMLATRFKEDPDVLETVGALSEKLSAALAELRELARGIHPAILSDHGLRPAILGLATRTPVDVECVIEVEDRLPAPVEAGAYFTVAEALTNVARYADAKSARVEIRRDDGDVVVLVSDDGVGGADARSGSGLRGLGDRIGALDGSLTVESPPGGGTRLVARIPISGNGAR